MALLGPGQSATAAAPSRVKEEEEEEEKEEEEDEKLRMRKDRFELDGSAAAVSLLESPRRSGRRGGVKDSSGDATGSASIGSTWRAATATCVSTTARHLKQSMQVRSRTANSRPHKIH